MKLLRYWTNFSAMLGLAMAATIINIGPAIAQFQKSDDALFIGGPELFTEVEPGSETLIYAIADDMSDNVFYMILYSFKGAITVKGAFRCDNEFEVLKTVTNKWRDIRCVKTDVFGRITTTTLSVGSTGKYLENF